MNMSNTNTHAYKVQEFLSEYEYVGEISQGRFGRVVEAKHRRYQPNGTRKSFVIKLVNEPDLTDDVYYECLILRKIGDLERENQTSHCVRLLRYDLFTGCLIFPKLGLTLEQFKAMAGRFSMDNIRDIGKQILGAVRFLHDNGILHTDIQGPNIMFVEPNNYYEKDGWKYLTSTNLQLIDFNSAIDITMQEFDNTETIQVRSHRAPEVILKIGWDKAAEMWSIGCVLFELLTGAQLFHILAVFNRSNQSLAIMEKVIGKFPHCMRASPYASQFFDESGSVRLCGLPTFLIGSKRKLEEYNKEKTEDSYLLFDLLRQMFTLLPAERISVQHAMDHEFFQCGQTVSQE